MPNNAIEFFDILGIDYSQLVEINENIQFKKIIIPDECFFSDENGGRRYFTVEYKQLIQDVRSFQNKHFIKDTCKKLYFSYAKYKKNDFAIGEKKLEKFFENQGYEIIYPENYTFKEQLCMLANCCDFASTIGSCSHNLIFLPEHANVLLIPRAHYLTGYQLALDFVVDLNVYYVDSSLSVLVKRKEPWLGPFYFYVSENLLRLFNIDRICDEKYYKEQLKDFRKYFRRAKLYNDLEERYQPEYYTRQFAYCIGKYRNSNKILMLLRKIRLRGPAKLRSVLNNMIQRGTK